MPRKPPNYWNKEKCHIEALKYSSRKSFSDNARGAYKAACANNWIDDICQHMSQLVKPVGYWDKSKCRKEALKFSNRTSFKNEAGSAYNSALKNGWLEDICKHMRVIRKKWTLTELKKEAILYKTRNEFSKGSPAAYSWAQRRKLLDDICYHMEVAGNREKRCVYVILNNRLKLAYVGITYNFEKRTRDHKSANNSTNSKILTVESDTTYEQLTDYTYTKKDIKNGVEKSFYDFYQQKGFKLVNDISRLGGVGSDNTIWDFETCIVEALSYSNKRDFRQGSSGAWSACQKHGWINQVCSHMEHLEMPKGHWGFEVCEKEALKYKHRSDFEKGCSSAYNAALKNNWIDEICQHTTPKKVKSKWGCLSELEKEAKKYEDRSSFHKGSPQAYRIAQRENCLDSICSHMLVKKVKHGYWTKENCALAALKFSTRKDFQNKFSTAYATAMKNGWLQEICKHMKTPNKWNHHDANAEVWKASADIYQHWIHLNKCGSKKLSRDIGLQSNLLSTMVKHFNKGWVPEDDSEWLSWVEKGI